LIALKVENVDFPDGIAFKCKQCGSCCRFIPGDVNAEEKRLIEAKGFVGFLGAPDSTGRTLIRRKKDGSCFFLTGKNKCAIYDVRPMICRIGPFQVKDWDYKNNVITVETRLDLACPGIHAGSEPASQDAVKAAQGYVREMVELTAKVEKLPITAEEVASIARKHIITNTVPFLKE
jgi:Fe-S-cluster containining protein